MTYPGGPGTPDEQPQSPEHAPGEGAGQQPGEAAGQQPGQQYGQPQPPYGQQPGQQFGQQPPAPEWQPPQPTQQLPPYGQPGAPYGQPPYGQPQPPQQYGQQGQYGQPGAYGQPYGVPGAPVPPPPPGYGPATPPPSGGNGRRLALIIGAIVAVLAIAGIAFAVTSGNGDKKTASSPTPSPSPTVSSLPSDFPSSLPSDSLPSDSLPSDTGFPSGTGTSTADVSESEGRDVVEQYLADINKQDEDHAATLICADQVANWRKSIRGKGGDFTVKVTDFTFKDSSASSDGGLDLDYSLDVADLSSDRTGTTDITFTVIDESGAKICGES